MLIPGVPSKMCWLVSVLEVILFATAVSSLCPEGAFSSVKESKETCITLHTVGKSTKVVLPHSLTHSALCITLHTVGKSTRARAARCERGAEVEDFGLRRKSSQMIYVANLRYAAS